MAKRWLALLLAQSCAAFMRPAQPAKRLQPVYFFDNLAKSISAATDLLQGKSRMTEANTAEAVRSVRRALLDADVSKMVVDAFVENVAESALSGDVTEGVEPSEQFIKIVYDELKRVMGGEDEQLAEDGEGAMQARAAVEYAETGPTVVLLCGLQGAGKTTAAAKLAKRLRDEEGRAPLLVAADVHRPAAVEQLRILGDQVGVPVYAEEFEVGRGDAVKIAQNGVRAAVEQKADLVIVDTAGRQVVDADLMRELRDVRAVTKPDETLLVLDAMTGQEAAALCKRFDDNVPLTGSILTKMDGDARGGAALSVRAVSGKPVKFVGVGERVEDLEPFFPARMASRILGMGDVVSLVEKAQKDQSEAEAQAQLEKAKAGRFDFDDYLTQAKMVSNMGDFANVAKMMPGMSGIDAAQIDAADARVKVQASMIASMTPKERADPDLIIKSKTALSRQRRIARGAGRDLATAKQFISEFQQMRTMIAKMAGQAPPDGAAEEPAAPIANRRER
eukprot:CAMPEP_0119269780 /NCGR_PEP_ID=MMETSP1329-20130426/7043_1 /TAXON_ID=114041 /ORGANISM="Genus nov. species nov., Strain RCC1024" /LENGTH=504 /DNA_ID=CAMNT_0007269781 /DNA_START=175 /DNA_END=1685 /DNA_ORIENTATION=+